MVAHTNCERCRRFRPIHAHGVCKSCYNARRYENGMSERTPRRPGEWAVCEECHREDVIHADGQCYRCWKREQAEMTAEAVDALVVERLPSMPREKEERREAAFETRGRKQRHAIEDRKSKYPQSPHGANCPLLKLVIRGEGGFTRGLIEADAYLRKHPDCDPRSAWQSKDGQTVRVTMADGSTIQFPREPAKADSRTRRDAAKQCRLAIFAVLERRGPMTAVQIATALSREPEYIRVAIRGSCGWFEKTQQTKDSAYRVTPKGIRDYAALNHGKPLAGRGTKGRKRKVGV